jgi:hypothetical protein
MTAERLRQQQQSHLPFLHPPTTAYDDEDDTMAEHLRQQFVYLNQQNAHLMQLLDELQMQRLTRRLLAQTLRQREERALEIARLLEACRDRTDPGEPGPEWLGRQQQQQPTTMPELNGARCWCQGRGGSAFGHGGGGRCETPLPPRAREGEEDHVPSWWWWRGAGAGGDAPPAGADGPPAAGRKRSYERLRPKPF